MMEADSGQRYSGPVLDAAIFPGVPEVYECTEPQFWVLVDDRYPFSHKAKFIWDPAREAWVWDSKST